MSIENKQLLLINSSVYHGRIIRMELTREGNFIPSHYVDKFGNLLIGNGWSSLSPDKQKDSFYNSRRYALSVIKRFYPEFKIIEESY